MTHAQHSFPAESKILVTGARGLVGMNLIEELRKQGYANIVALTSETCDLTNFAQTVDFFKKHAPTHVFHAAAAVYGIMGNMERKGYSYLQNVLINTHVVEACRQASIKKLVAMGSGCVYPYPSPGLPLTEDMVWQGAPHPSEDSYAHAKRAMLAQLNAYKESYGLCSAFVISGNLYGPHDKFDTKHGHVTPSLIRKFYEASKTGDTITIWGDGSAKRDFLFAEDAARALIAIMQHSEGPINMGSGAVNAIRDIVDILAEHTSMQDKVVWDASKPNGQEYRAYDLSKLFETGFRPRFSLMEGLKKTYTWYASHAETARK